MKTTRQRAERDGKPYEPSVRDIHRECEQIQATWSPRERAKRAGRPAAGGWEPPNIKLANVFESGDEDEGSWLSRAVGAEQAG